MTEVIAADRISVRLVFYVFVRCVFLRRGIQVFLLDQEINSILLFRILKHFSKVDFCSFDLGDCRGTSRSAPFWEREQYLNAIYADLEANIQKVLSTVVLPEIVVWENFKQFISRYVVKRYGPEVAKTLLARHFIDSTQRVTKVFLDRNNASLELQSAYRDVVVLGGGGRRLRDLTLSVFRFAVLSRKLGKARAQTWDQPDQNQRRKIAVQYVHGVSHDGYGTDWDWFKASGLSPDQVLYFGENSKKTRTTDIALAEEMGVPIVLLHEIIGRILHDESSLLERNALMSLSWFSIFRLCLGNHTQQLTIELLLTYISIVAKWRCVFRSLGIGGYVNVGDANFDAVPKMHALETLGGVNLTYEFSATGFQSFFDACPTGRHQYLAWGRCSAEIIQNSSNLVNYRLEPERLIFAGNMKLHLQHFLTSTQSQTLELIKRRQKTKVVLIADSASTHLKITSVKNIDEFYKALVPVIERYPDVLFVVKPQRPSDWSDFSRQILNDAQRNNNVMLLDQPMGLTHFLFPVVDLVIGMPIYASIIFEAIAAGKDAICFDNSSFPHVIRKYHSEFSLVSDAQKLMHAVEVAFRGELELGLLRHKLEPYGDGRGHERFGSYLKIWSDCLNEFPTADDALEHVEARYYDVWPVPEVGTN